MNILLVNDTSTSRNQGCQATMYMLNRALRLCFPGCRVSRVYLPTINYPFSGLERRWLLPSGGASIGRTLRRFMASRKPVIRELVDAISGADLVIVNGEGSVLETQTNAKMIFMTLEVAHHFNVECHLINFTAHLTRRESIELASVAFARCASVAVREPLSYFHVMKFFKDVKLYPDVVAGLDIRSGEQFSTTPFIMIGGTSATISIQRNSQRMEKLKNGLSAVCKSVTDQGFDVRLMGWYRDEWLQSLIGPNVFYDEVDYVAYLAFCRGASVNFTGRHHGCVMSFAAGCPFITGSANCFKCYGDRLLYESEGSVVEFERLAPVDLAGELVRAAKSADARRAVLQQKRSAYLPFVFGAIENIVRRKDDLVESGVFDFNPDAAQYRFVQNMPV